MKLESPATTEEVKEAEVASPVATGQPAATSLAVQQTGQLATQQEEDYGLSPEELAAIAQASGQNTNANEIQISRLAIMQKNSPECEDNNPAYKDGMMVDNKTRVIYSTYGPPPWLTEKGLDPKAIEAVHYVRFLPIFKLPNEFIHWKNRSTEGTGFHFKTLDEKDQRVRAGSFPPFGNWKPDPANPQQKAPPVTNNINYLGVLINEAGEVISDYIIVTFAKGNTNVGKKITTALQYVTANKKPYWSFCVGLFTYWNKVEKGSYHALDSAVIKNFPKNPKTMKMCRDVAMYLADKEKGAERQEGFLNAAEPEQDETTFEQANSAAAAGGHIPEDSSEPNF